MTGARKPFGMAQCLFLREQVLITAPVPPVRPSSHAAGDPGARVALTGGAAVLGAALARVLRAGLAGWDAPLPPHDPEAAQAAAQAALSGLAQAAAASKAQAKAETGLVWATIHDDGRVLLEPSRQARGTLAFDGLGFRLETSPDEAAAAGRALMAAMGLCRGTPAFEGTLPPVAVADIARVGAALLVAPRAPARSDLAFSHPQAGQLLDMGRTGPAALDAALATALDASRSGALAPPAAPAADLRAAFGALARAAGRPKSAGATAERWSLAEVAGGGAWFGPADQGAIPAALDAPPWQAVPEPPDGTRAQALLDRMARP